MFSAGLMKRRGLQISWLPLGLLCVIALASPVSAGLVAYNDPAANQHEQDASITRYGRYDAQTRSFISPGGLLKDQASGKWTSISATFSVVSTVVRPTSLSGSESVVFEIETTPDQTNSRTHGPTQHGKAQPRQPVGPAGSLGGNRAEGRSDNLSSISDEDLFIQVVTDDESRPGIFGPLQNNPMIPFPVSDEGTLAVGVGEADIPAQSTWAYEITFSGLDPTKVYAFQSLIDGQSATSSPPGGLEYSSRFSILGADRFKNAGSSNVDELDAGVLAIDHSKEQHEGYVIRWVGISAFDGTFTVRSEVSGAWGTNSNEPPPWWTGPQAFELQQIQQVTVPIPAPGSATLALIGMPLLAFAVRRRQAAARRIFKPTR